MNIELIISRGRAPAAKSKGLKDREVLMGVGGRVASVIMLTFSKRPGPHADTARALIG